MTVFGPFKPIVKTTHLWGLQLRDWDTFRLDPSVDPFQLGPKMDPEMGPSSIVSNCGLGTMDTELVGVLGVLDVLGVTGTRQFTIVDFILTK